ncbi:hypothetical protein [uncultured Thiothrix sp.]|uniref:hypothetical protein n=1 Tax=uncultured Thiothrix sp. TaxID=223185 RepID=UPI002606E439|nr:hypothetical protein [uncultured Thiothrix sp.]
MKRLTEKVPASRIAWALQITEPEVRQWEVLIPLLESQYIRESSLCSHQANRRKIRKTTAIALFNDGIDGLAAWLGSASSRCLYSNDEFLTEYQSLLIEYATKGAIKGLSIKALAGNQI